MIKATQNQEWSDDHDGIDSDSKKNNRERTTLISHNIMIDGRRTSVRLEKEM